MNLLDAKIGQSYIIKRVLGDGNELRRLLDMGFTPRCKLFVESIAPSGGAVLVGLRGFKVALRENAASLIEIEVFDGV